MGSTDRQALVRSVVADMKLLASDDQLRPLDSLMIIELVAALEDATGVDLLGGPLTPETFASVQSISEFIERASAG